MKRVFASLVLFLGVVSFAMVGCGDDDGDPECVRGTACVCQGDCSKTCGGDGKGCSFSCPKDATCSFSCPGGGCSVDGQNAKSVTVDCPSVGGCAVTCNGGGDVCKITSCTTSCQLTCDGATTCENSCDVTSACTTNQ
jgi:hypothetical protein